MVSFPQLCHLLGSSHTTSIYQFRLLSRRVRNLQLHTMLVAAFSEDICVCETENKYCTYICIVIL